MRVSPRSAVGSLSSLDLRFAAAGLVDSTGTGCYIAASAIFFSRKLGLTPGLIGFGLTLSGVLGFVTTIPWGRAADRWGARPVLVLLQCIRATAFGLFALVGSLTAFLAVCALLGLADLATPPVQQALIGAAVGEERRQRTLAVVRSARNIGFSFGALLAAAAISVGTTLAYDSIVLLNAASFVFIAILMGTLPVNPRPTPAQRQARTARGKWRIRDRRYTKLTMLNGVLTMHMTLLSPVLPLWLLRHTHTPAAMMPFLLLINAVLAVLLQVPVAGRARSPRAATTALGVAGVALAACCLAMPLAGRLDATAAAVVAVGAVLALTAAELAQSAGGWELSFRLAPEDRRGQYLGVFSLGTTAQLMAGPLLLTTAVFTLGTLGWVLLAAMTVAAGIFVPWVTRRGRRERRRAEHRRERRAFALGAAAGGLAATLCAAIATGILLFTPNHLMHASARTAPASGSTPSAWRPSPSSSPVTGSGPVTPSSAANHGGHVSNRVSPAPSSALAPSHPSPAPSPRPHTTRRVPSGGPSDLPPGLPSDLPSGLSSYLPSGLPADLPQSLPSALSPYLP